jgi:acyl phosphate:glycerol-3-phosphate acyltransferase
MDPLILTGTIVISYLLGAISFVRVISHFVAPQKGLQDYEVRIASTGETRRVDAMGASSISSILGERFGLLMTVLDFLKVTATVMAFKLFYSGEYYYLFAAVAAMAGHIWPVYYRFRGNPVLTATLGGLLVVDWLGAVICPVIGTLVGVLLLREISAGVLVWCLMLIPWMWLRTHNLVFVGYAVAVNVLFLLAAVPKIRLIVSERRTTRASLGHGS